MTPDFSLYFFGDYPHHVSAADAYDTLSKAVQHADSHDYSAIWIPERHFHSFGGIFPNPSVLAAAIAQQTTRVRINSGSVVLPLHDPIRVAEEWSVVDNLSAGRIGIGCAPGWNSRDFVFFPERYGTHREAMYHQVNQVRRLWRGESLPRTSGDGRVTDVTLHPRPVQSSPPMFAAVVGRRESFAAAAREDLGIVTNLMTQDIDQLAENIAYYRAQRAAHGLDPAAGRVTVLLHTYLESNAEEARQAAFDPLCSYMGASLSLFGQVTNSLGWNIDLDSATADDLSYLFGRAYDRYCHDRALIGSPQSCRRIVEALGQAGVDEIAALIDFGLPARRMLTSLEYLDELRAYGFPVSPGQQRMWLADELAPGNNSQNEPKAFAVRGELDVAALRWATDELVARHQALRTVYRQRDGEPRQVTLPPHGAQLLVEDRTGVEDEEVAAVIAEESRRVFDLASGPLVVFRLLRLASDHYVFVMSMHHIAVDAVSVRVLTQELSELYHARVDRRRARLVAPAETLHQATARQLARSRAVIESDMEYWTRRLSGDLPVLRLPEDRPRPAVQSFEGSAHFSAVDTAITAALRRLSGDAGATLFMTLLTGLAITIRHFTADDDIIIGIPVSNRPQGNETVGFFVNTLPLRIDTAGDPDFATLLKQVRSAALDAYDHASAPFEEVVRAVAPPRDTSRTPVFQLMAEYKHTDAFSLHLAGTDTTALDAGRQVAMTDMALHLINREDEIIVHTEYSTRLFDEDTIGRMIAHFHGVLSRAVATPDRAISLLTPSASAGSRHGRTTEPSAATIPELIAERASKAPDAIAVVDGHTSLSYGELHSAALHRAQQLLHFGVESGDVVAVWMARTVENITTLLAIQQCGAAYLPLDPALRDARIGEVLSDSGARLVVVDDEESTLPASVSALRLNTTDEVAVSDGAGLPVVEPHYACYVIYTSGSTGRPKGVVVPHRAVVNMCGWLNRRVGFGAGDRSAVVCGQSFDAAVLEIWPALTSGASVAIAPEEMRRDPSGLAQWFADYDVTFSLLPTPLGEEVMALAQPPPLRTLMVGGDVLRRRPSAYVPYETLNAYGPTEATVLVTAHTVSPDGGEPICIGAPIDNTTLAVLDTNGDPVADGVAGELYIAGPCLADGYLNDPRLTASRFVYVNGERMYRTGDLVRWNSRGELEYRGRLDDQIKVRGYRVEPSEVTRALRGLPMVADAVVLAGQDSTGSACLVGYVVPAQITGDFPAAVQHELAQALPDYLVPRSWSLLDRMPLDANGKVDRSSLPEPERFTSGSVSDDGNVVTLRGLWAAMLEVDAKAITARSSFFDLGGHSLSAIRLLGRAREQLEIECGLLDFYQDPSFGAMAAKLPEQDVVLEEVVSVQQAGMLRNSAANWNITVHVDFTGPLRRDALRAALETVTARHQSLRTSFVWRDGQWWQRVLPRRTVELPLLDSTAAARLSDDAMDVSQGHLLRAGLMRVDNDHWRLVLVVHHVVCDGWSVAVLLRDLASGYRMALSGEVAGLPAAGQSVEYARWQREHHDLAVRANRLAYWRERLSDTAFGVDLPGGRPAVESTGSALQVRREVPFALIRAIETLARDRGCTPFAVWAAATGVFLAEATARHRIAIGTPYASREHSDHDDVVAILSRVSILEVNAAPDVSFGDLAVRTMRDYAEGVDHFVPLLDLTASLAADRDDEIPRTMPVSLVYQSSADVRLDFPGLTTTVTDVPNRAPRARTQIFVEPRGDGTVLGVMCDGRRRDKSTVDGWLDRLVEILSAATAAPDRTVAEITKNRGFGVRHGNHEEETAPDGLEP